MRQEKNHILDILVWGHHFFLGFALLNPIQDMNLYFMKMDFSDEDKMVLHKCYGRCMSVVTCGAVSKNPRSLLHFM